MLAVVLGHLYPAQLGFRGGKGVATTIGALVVLSPRLALALVAAFALVLAATRAFTASGLIAFGLLPIVAAFLGQGRACVSGMAAVALLVLFAHRANIMRLLGITEKRHGAAEVQDRDGTEFSSVAGLPA